MSLRIMVACEGTRPPGSAETCRAFLPLRPTWTPVSQLIDPDAAINQAYEAGWSRTPGGKDLCPSCTRHAHLMAALAIGELPLPNLEGLQP